MLKNQKANASKEQPSLPGTEVPLMSTSLAAVCQWLLITVSAISWHDSVLSVPRKENQK
jgi:hypothetical protein